MKDKKQQGNEIPYAWGGAWPTALWRVPLLTGDLHGMPMTPNIARESMDPTLGADD